MKLIWIWAEIIFPPLFLVNAEKMQKPRKITIFIIFPLCQNLIQLELKILTILILILDITCYYVEIRSFNYITHFRKRIMWKIKSRKLAKTREKTRKIAYFNVIFLWWYSRCRLYLEIRGNSLQEDKLI